MPATASCCEAADWIDIPPTHENGLTLLFTVLHSRSTDWASFRNPPRSTAGVLNGRAVRNLLIFQILADAIISKKRLTAAHVLLLNSVDSANM